MGKERDLTRGPGEVAAAEKVKMEMGDSFPTVGAVVDDEAIPGLVELPLAGDFLGSSKEIAKNGMIFRGDGGMAGMVLLGDEEDMNGGLRSDITEGEDVIILIDDVGFGFAVDDPLKDRFGHGPSFLPDGQFEELGTEMAGTGTDEVDNLVVKPLAGPPPGGGA